MSNSQNLPQATASYEQGQVILTSQIITTQGQNQVTQAQNSAFKATPAKQMVQNFANENQAHQFAYSGRTIQNGLVQQEYGTVGPKTLGGYGVESQGVSIAPGQNIRRSYNTTSGTALQIQPEHAQQLGSGQVIVRNSVYGGPQTQTGYTTQNTGGLLVAPNGAITQQRRSYQGAFNGQSFASNGVVRQGEPRLISESKLQSRVIEHTEGQPHVVDVKYGQSYEINRSTHVDTNVRVRENRLEVREQRPSLTQANLNKDITIKSEKAVISQRIVEKPVDVYIEKPVPVYKEVEVPYDVIIEKPIEKIIERDVITEIIMEKVIDKFVEIPVHKVIEIPIEKTIERPVFYDKIVDVPRQVFRDTHTEVVVETPVYVEKVIEVDERDIGKYKYDRILPTEVKVYEKPVYKQQRRTHQNIVEKTVDVPVEKLVQRQVPRMVDRPVERIVDKPVYIDNIIEKVVQVPVEKIVYNRVEQVVEEPEFIDQIIEKPVHIERVVEHPFDQFEEVLVEKPVFIDRVIEKEVEQIVEKEVRIDREVKVPVQRLVERPVYRERIVTKEVPHIIEQEVIYETTVPVERINIVEEVIPVPIDRIIERPVERTIEKYVDVIVEREVFEDDLVEDVQYVEKIVHVPLERVVERPVFRENIIEKAIYIEKIVEKEIEVIVEKIVEVPVEKIIEVPVDVIIDNPIPRQKIVQRDVYIDKKVSKPMRASIRASTEDASVRQQVVSFERQISETKITISKLKAEYELIQKKQINLTLRSDIDYTSQNQKLKELIVEMENKINTLKTIGHRKSYTEGMKIDLSKQFGSQNQ